MRLPELCGFSGRFAFVCLSPAANTPVSLHVHKQDEDGSSYVVFDELGSIHNLAYSMSRLNGDAAYLFNRLVDPQEVASITVNDVTFS